MDERALFGFGDKVNERWHEQYEAARKIEFRTAMKWFIKMKIGGIVTALISILVIACTFDSCFNRRCYCRYVYIAGECYIRAGAGYVMGAYISCRSIGKT